MDKPLDVFGGGGSPLKSYVARRISVRLTASADGLRFLASRRLKTNRSISLRTQPWLLTVGNADNPGFCNDHGEGCFLSVAAGSAGREAPSRNQCTTLAT